MRLDARRALTAGLLAAALWFGLLPAAGGSAAAQCVPAAFPPDWLQEQEEAGGHTLARHVGWTDRQLVERLRNSPNIAAASTYPDRETAAAAIQAALVQNAAALNRWVRGAPVGATRAVDYDAGREIGRVASRPPGLDNIAPGQRLRAVVRKTRDGGCLLLTSYPIRETRSGR